MDLQISHIKRSKYRVLVNEEFNVVVDLEYSTAKDGSNMLKEAELDEIFNDVEKFHQERKESENEETNLYDKYGITEQQFL